MTYRRGAKDDGCCSVGFLKCILHIFNFIFLLSGCAVLGVGVWTLLAKRHHLSLLVTATYASTAYMLVLAGVLVILVTIMGCVAIWRLNRCLLLAYTFLLLLIFLLEAVAGVIAYVYEEQVWHELADSLNTTFIESYGIDSSRTDAINDLQSSFKCCGANSYQDWQRSEWLRLKPRTPNKVPDSCCKTTTPGCGGLVHPSNVYYDLSGCAVLGVGLWTLLAKRHHLSLLVTATYASTAYMLVLAGVLVILVTIMGCVAIWRLNRCLLLAYTFLLLLIFLLEAVAGVIAYVYEEQVWHELADSLNTTFIESYGIDSSRTDAINDLQSSFKCCGANSYQDWQRSEWLRLKPRTPNKVPDSCCKTTTPSCGGLVHPSNVYYDGCINALDEQIREHLIIVGAVGLGICLVQVFGMIFSCCLYLRLRDYRRHPQYY